MPNLNPIGSMASKSPAIVAYGNLRESQHHAAAAASRAEDAQELLIWIEEDVKRPCNLQTHHDSRCCSVRQVLQSVHAM